MTFHDSGTHRSPTRKRGMCFPRDSTRNPSCRRASMTGFTDKETLVEMRRRVVRLSAWTRSVSACVLRLSDGGDVGTCISAICDRGDRIGDPTLRKSRASVDTELPTGLDDHRDNFAAGGGGALLTVRLDSIEFWLAFGTWSLVSLAIAAFVASSMTAPVKVCVVDQSRICNFAVPQSGLPSIVYPTNSNRRLMVAALLWNWS